MAGVFRVFYIVFDQFIMFHLHVPRRIRDAVVEAVWMITHRQR